MKKVTSLIVLCLLCLSLIPTTNLRTYFGFAQDEALECTFDADCGDGHFCNNGSCEVDEDANLRFIVTPLPCGGLACAYGCNPSTNVCNPMPIPSPVPVCGNGMIEAPELCDGTGCPAGQSCVACVCIPSPSPIQMCGNGMIEAPELCDGTGCPAGQSCVACVCVSSPSPSPIMSPSPMPSPSPIMSPSPSPSPIMSPSSSPSPIMSPSPSPSPSAVCGNGMIEAPEICDDGNMIDNDGCQSNCQFQICDEGCGCGSICCADTYPGQSPSALRVSIDPSIYKEALTGLLQEHVLALRIQYLKDNNDFDGLARANRDAAILKKGKYKIARSTYKKNPDGSYSIKVNNKFAVALPTMLSCYKQCDPAMNNCACGNCTKMTVTLSSGAMADRFVCTPKAGPGACADGGPPSMGAGQPPIGCTPGNSCDSTTCTCMCGTGATAIAPCDNTSACPDTCITGTTVGGATTYMCTPVTGNECSNANPTCSDVTKQCNLTAPNKCMCTTANCGANGNNVAGMCQNVGCAGTKQCFSDGATCSCQEPCMNTAVAPAVTCGGACSDPTQKCAPAGGGCNCQACNCNVAGQTKCSGTQVQTCDGCMWGVAANCPAGQQCKANTNSCQPCDCMTGDKQCSGTKIQSCGADGCNWSTPANCPAGQSCDATTKTCKTPACGTAGNNGPTCNADPACAVGKSCLSLISGGCGCTKACNASFVPAMAGIPAFCDSTQKCPGTQSCMIIFIMGVANGCGCS